MHTDTFIVYIKTNDIYKDIAEHVEKRFDASNYELDRSLLTGKKRSQNLKSKSKTLQLLNT